MKTFRRFERVLMNKDLFFSLCGRVSAPPAVRGQIGTYSEKTLHHILKYYFDPSGEYHEKKIGRYTADIAFEDRIIEIQTRQFFRMKNKLDAFLSLCPTTIVYPVAREKTLIWVDPETGEETAPRKCPRRPAEYEVFPELYSIREFLKNEKLSIAVLSLALVEKRLRCGYARDGKRGSVRLERYPTALLDEIWLRAPADYRRFLPDKETFTSREFGGALKISKKREQTAVSVLRHMGLIVPVGKTGNAIIYQKQDEEINLHKGDQL